MSKDKITRRKFVAGTTGVALSAMIVPRHVLGGAGYQPPSDTVNIAVVGCGGQGAADATELVAGGQNIVALADVDFGYVDKAAEGRTKGRDGKPNQNAIKLQEAYNKAKRYADFRKMLEQQKDIDAVLVATPDHTHAVVAKSGDGTWQARLCREAAGLVGARSPRAARDRRAHESRHADGQSGPFERRRGAHQRMDSGRRHRPGERSSRLDQSPDLAAGRSASVKAAPSSRTAPAARARRWDNGWTGGGPVRLQGTGMGFGNDWTRAHASIRTSRRRWTATIPMPSGLDWDLFLGPAPEVPYHPIYHPFNWRGWMDWGTGAIGDMAAHLIDHPYWALGSEISDQRRSDLYAVGH